ncbi:3-deoxy-7-phosphoheptulonate synthase [Sporohalobacter salinus]|uniref:3-deoxy-7-phosphoheptulonate synthase n=1 Tax=Sporohalobacter salinus TaxID=1494606 RepID=UPI00196046DF|nr:3-deoxy-7-phosphoheptulonate synthase [Sporohalobacter salinus]MBM7622592.1 3-deoxy-7-phosphoheptulonate synthase [Sporohalobacter salinus]
MSQSAEDLYPLAGKSEELEKSIIEIEDVEIGGRDPTIIVSSYHIEDEEQLLTFATALKSTGAKILLGGVYKPQVSPYFNQEVDDSKLKILTKVKEKIGLLRIVEVMDVRQVESIAEYADVFKIGSQDMQNYPLLQEVGKYNLPVILSRGMSATIREWLLAAEYILNAGNQNVILCEKGVKGFQQHTENIFDISVVPIIRQLSHLPIIIDPGQAAGRSDLVAPLAKAGLAAGADGVMMEIHSEANKLFYNKEQSLLLSQFEELIDDIGVNKNVLS